MFSFSSLWFGGLETLGFFVDGLCESLDSSAGLAAFGFRFRGENCSPNGNLDCLVGNTLFAANLCPGLDSRNVTQCKDWNGLTS